MSDRERIALVVSKDVGLAVLDSLLGAAPNADLSILTVDDRADGRSRLARLKSLADAHGIPIEVVTTAASANEWLDASAPTLGIVAGWYHLIPQRIREAAPRGFFGVHFSSLPRFRGFAPVVWAMLADEPRVGFSIFRLDEGVDEGMLAAQGEVEVGSRSIGEVLADLETASAASLAALLPSLLDGSAALVPQSSETASYCGARTPADGRVDWRMPADQVEIFVRAQSRPYPGAFGVHKSGIVRIWSATYDRDHQYFGLPGQLVRIDQGRPVICCGNRTALRLDDFDSTDLDGIPIKLPLRLTSLRLA